MRANKTTLILAATTGAVVATAWVPMYLQQESTSPNQPTRQSPVQAARTQPATAPARTAVSTERPINHKPAGCSLSIDNHVDTLADLFAAGAAASERGDHSDEERVHRSIETSLETLFRCVHNPSEKLLALLCREAAQTADVPGAGDRPRFRVLSVVLAHALVRRAEACGKGTRCRASFDRLLTTAIDSMHEYPALVSSLAAILESQPWLGAFQEPAVHALIERSALPKNAFLIDPAARLQLQLWVNLSVSGSRSEFALVRQASLAADTVGNAARQRAGLQFLMRHENASVRQQAIDLALEKGDPDTAHRLAVTAAEQLPAHLAIEVIATMSAAHQQQSLQLCYGPLTLIARSAPEALRDAYSSFARIGTRAAMRAEIVRAGPVSLALRAFEADLEPRVRLAALVPISTDADPAIQERVFREALSDREIGGHGARLPALLNYAHNLLAQRASHAVLRELLAEAEALPSLGPVPKQQIAALRKKLRS